MPAGRPTSYKEEYVKIAYNYCLMGADDKKLSEFFEVTESTINNWKNQHPEFLESIRKGKDQHDTETVEKSLLERAKGYNHEEEKVFCNNGKIVTYKCIKHYPPDPKSIIFWLKNRNPARWRETIDFTGRFNVANFDVPLTPEEEEAYKQRLADMYGDDILGNEGDKNGN